MCNQQRTIWKLMCLIPFFISYEYTNNESGRILFWDRHWYWYCCTMSLIIWISCVHQAHFVINFGFPDTNSICWCLCFLLWSKYLNLYITFSSKLVDVWSLPKSLKRQEIPHMGYSIKNVSTLRVFLINKNVCDKSVALPDHHHIVCIFYI